MRAAPWSTPQRGEPVWRLIPDQLSMRRSWTGGATAGGGQYSHHQTANIPAIPGEFQTQPCVIGFNTFKYGTNLTIFESNRILKLKRIFASNPRELSEVHVTLKLICLDAPFFCFTHDSSESTRTKFSEDFDARTVLFGRGA